MTPEIQKANDIIAAMQQQRDTALNAVVQLSADGAAQRRRIAELEADIVGLKQELDRLKASAKAPDDAIGTIPKGNDYSDSLVHPGVVCANGANTESDSQAA